MGIDVERCPRGRRGPTGNRVYAQKVYRGFESHPLRQISFKKQQVDSRVLRNETLRTPPGPEGSNGSRALRVSQGCLAIIFIVRRVTHLNSCPI